MIKMTKRFLALSLGLAFIAGMSQLAAPAVRAEEPVGLLTVVGMVKVNGKPAATGDIVASGSTVETAAKSSAVVSLGKLGRVEAQAETQMTLRYTDSSIWILLADGSVKVETGAGVSAIIKRKE